MKDKEYTTEETAKYKAARNKALRDERSSKLKGELIWDSKKNGTYHGSLREDFTGQKRDNNIN